MPNWTGDAKCPLPLSVDFDKTLVKAHVCANTSAALETGPFFANNTAATLVSWEAAVMNGSGMLEALHFASFRLVQP